MTETSTKRAALIFLALVCVCLFLSNPWQFITVGRTLFQPTLDSNCDIWSLDQYNISSKRNLCPNEQQIKSTIWTNNGTGIMKYLQWMIVRRFASIRFLHLDRRCQIQNDIHFHRELLHYPLILVYVLSIQTDASQCSPKIRRIVTINDKIKHIYFTRRSTRAMQAFNQLDALINITVNFTELSTFRHLIDYVPSKKWIIIYSEDLIETKLNLTEMKLLNFMSQLGISISHTNVQQSLRYDSHHFISDSTWWDQSYVIEQLLDNSTSPRPTNVNYSSEFFYHHGRQSFSKFLLDNRQCFRQGIFFQMQSSSIIPRKSTDPIDRCPSKPFDCAFSDLYSLEDREEMYQSTLFHPNAIKCGFIVPSILDDIRQRYARNETCETIVFTVITSCYDPLPEIQGTIHPSFCFIALVDNRTMNALNNRNASGSWDVINLGANATMFSIEAKTTESVKLLGIRLFPLAKWILWLDGKAKIVDLPLFLSQLPTPFIGAHHPDWQRDLESEMPATIAHLRYRAGGLTLRFNHTLRDMNFQENQYRLEGIYNRSQKFGLRLYDIAVLMYRNHYPCMERYMCAWHNEINYYSFRGQLSVYYPAIRLNLIDHTDFIPNKFFSTFGHRPVC